MIVATLYSGREVFVPIALAILLSFVLAPLVRANLRDWRAFWVWAYRVKARTLIAFLSEKADVPRESGYGSEHRRVVRFWGALMIRSHPPERLLLMATFALLAIVLLWNFIVN